MFSYQDRVLYSGKLINIVQAGRRLGKTKLCIQMMMQGHGERVIFIGKSRYSNEVLIQHIVESYHDQIAYWSTSTSMITFRNGNTVRFFDALAPHCEAIGMMWGTVIVDDAGQIKYELFESIVSSFRQKIYKNRILVIGDHAKPGSILAEYIRLFQTLALSDVYAEEYNWIDSLPQLSYGAKAYYDDAEWNMPPEKFKQSHGPWGLLEYEHKTNRELVRFLIHN